MHKYFHHPMPETCGWEIDEFEKLERARFDDPDDPRRFLAAGDNQIAGVGDGFQRNSPPWLDTVQSLWPDIPVYGSIIEVSECLTRLVGQVNSMMWMAEFPERMGAVINRLGAYYLAMARAQLQAGRGLLDGFVIWGDVAYKKSTFMAPAYWREYYQALGGRHGAGDPRRRAPRDLPRLRECPRHLSGLHRNRRGCLQSAGGQGRHGCARSAPPLRASNGFLRQQRRDHLGDRRSRCHPP